MISVNLIVVSTDDGLYQKVLEELGEENIYPDIIKGGTLRETVSVLNMEAAKVLEVDSQAKDPDPLFISESIPPDEKYPDRGDPDEVVRYVRSYVRLNLGNTLNLRTIAHEIGLSSTYLCSLFRKHEGITLQKFIEKQRIERAAYLLETENASVGEISQRVGFRSNSYFSKIFRQYYGETPLKYRNRLKYKKIRG